MHYPLAANILQLPQRAAAFGDKPSLISWQPFCAEED
jgi:hypothetical protein